MSNYRDLSIFGEDELLHKHKETGQAEYFGELYNRYIPLIYGVCLKYLQDPKEAQSTVVQLFEDLLPRTSECDSESIRTWLYEAVKNQCYQIILRENVDANIVSNADRVESEEVLHLLYDEQEDTKGRISDLQRCIDRLPDKQRICITHFFLKKMSYVDIVEKTGYSMNAVRNNIENGKRNLESCITRNTK